MQNTSLIRSQTSPEIERISVSEVYLVRNRARYRRVCGSTSTYTGGICTYEAGFRTNHRGKGFCWLHETSESAAAWNVIFRNELDPDTKPLLRYLQNAGTLSSMQLSDLSGEIMMLYALVGSLQEGRTTLTPGEIDLLRRIVIDITKAKETKSKIEREVKFEVEGIKNFINQVFSIIVSQLDAGASKRILNMIMEKVIMPLEASDRLSGDVKELHAAAGHHKKRIEKKKDEVQAKYSSEKVDL